jgi:membrane protein
MATITAAEREHGWRFWWHVAVATVKNFLDPDTSPRCAGAAFFGFLSFFPAIATVALIVGLILDPVMLRGATSVLQYVLPEGALGILEEQLRRLAEQPGTTLGLGLLISVPLALWSGSRGVDALLFALSQVRGQKERRGIIMQVAVAVGTTIVGGVFVVVALVTVAGLPALVPFPSGEELLVFALRWPVLLGLTVVVFALLYRYGPDRHPHRFRFIWPGAVLASLLWILAGAVFSIYVENWGNFEVTFGSVSAAVVLLLWMYNSTQILVLGAAFNTEIQRALTGKPKREVESRDA